MRIEVVSYEEHPLAVNIDFEYGNILVNITFQKDDLEKLQEIIAKVMRNWIDQILKRGMN